MNNVPSKVGWGRKFSNAFRGIVVGVRGQNSFIVHFPSAVLVIALALWLGLDQVRVCLLLLCVGMVLASELFNSSFERLARSITSEFDENVRDALDIASGAVLALSIMSAIVGAVIFVTALFGQ